MRIKVIFTNYEVEGDRNFLLEVPFRVSHFSDLHEYLKDYFELPESAHLNFALDEFNIMHKESLQTLLEDLDILRVTLRDENQSCNKRKGSALPDQVQKKVKTLAKTDDKFAEFVHDILKIKDRMKFEKEDSDSSESDEIEKQSILSKSKSPKARQTPSKESINKRLNDFTKKLQKSNQKIIKKQASSSSSSMSSDNDEIQTKQSSIVKTNANKQAPLIINEKNKLNQNQNAQKIEQNSIPIKSNEKQVIQTKLNEQKQIPLISNTDTVSKKYQKILEKEINQSQKISNPMNSTFHRGQIMKNDSNALVEVKLPSQSTSLIDQVHKAPVVEIKQPVVAVLPKQSVNTKVKHQVKYSSSSSSEDSSSSDEEQTIQKKNNSLTNCSKKIQLSSQRVGNVPQVAQNPSVMSPLKGPNKEHILNIQIKNPLQIYEDKKPLWKEISGFKTKVEAKLQKASQAVINKTQHVIQKYIFQFLLLMFTQFKIKEEQIKTKQQNKIVDTKSDESSQPFLGNDSSKKQVYQSSAVMDSIQKMVDKEILKKPDENKPEQVKAKEGEDLPPFDLNGFDKIAIKDLIDYEKSLGKNFFAENDLIYFKDLELDEEKFIPKVSEWKKGTITQILGVKQVRVAVSSTEGIESSIFNTSIFCELYLKSHSQPIADKQEVVALKKQEISQISSEQPPAPLRTSSYEQDKDIMIGRQVYFIN